MINYPKGAERYFVIQNRQQTIELLKLFLEKGYRWIVREPGADHLLLFSLKPKKYMKIESWGYENENLPGAKMAEIIKNTDITEIRWQNRQPTDLEQFIKDNEESGVDEI